MASLAIAATMIGGGVMAYSQVQQGKAAEAEGKAAYNESVNQNKLYEYNARVNKIQAAEVQNKAIYEATLHRKQTRALIGRQRAGMAAAGLSLTEGSPMSLIEETAAKSETDAQMILREGLINRQAYEAAAWQNKAAGTMALTRGINAKRAGKNAKKASLWQAGGTLLTAASSGYGLGNKYLGWGSGGGGGGAATYGPFH